MPNVGNLDRLLRGLIGLVVIAAPLLSGWGIVLSIASIIAGAILLATAAFGFCPIYALFGLSSKRNAFEGGRQ